MIKTDIKSLLEYAGVDTSQGKAKALIEKITLREWDEDPDHLESLRSDSIHAMVSEVLKYMGISEHDLRKEQITPEFVQQFDDDGVDLDEVEEILLRWAEENEADSNLR